MSIGDVKSWHWFAASIAIGLLLAFSRRYAASQGVLDYGESFNGHHDLQSALLREVTLADGRMLRAFSGLTLYPETIAGDSGQPRPVLILSGDLIGSARLNPATGQRESAFGRRSYLAPMPYSIPASHGRPAASYPSLRQYLDTLASRGVHYRYAWWCEPRWSFALWLASSIASIGVLAPLGLNLFFFGSFRRPVEARGIDLRHIHTASAPATEPQPVPNFEQVQQMADGLESQLQDSAAPAAAPVSELEPIRPLSPAPSLEPAIASSHDDPRNFGQDKDDFYPTERHHPHAPPEVTDGKR